MVMAASLLLAPLATRADLIWKETFSYADGNILTVAGAGTYLRASGAGNDLLVHNSKLEVAATGGVPVSRADDDYRLFPAPYTNSSTTVYYASYTVICTNLPNGPGTYISMFVANSTTFYGRVFALTNGTVLPNTFRLGIAGTAGTASKVFPVDLATNVTYKLVVAYDTVNKTGTIWVNPINQGDVSLTSSDTVSGAVQVQGYGFRQGGTFGNAFFIIDDLSTGTTFDEASTNTLSTNAVAPIIVQQPVSRTNFVGDTFTLTGNAAGQGFGNWTYTWLKNGSPFTNPDGNTNELTFASAQISNTGNYALVATTPFGLSATSSVAFVWVTNAPVPPSFVTQPVKQTVYRGQSVTFTTTTIGPPPISYQWQSNNVDISGETGSSLTLTAVQTNFAANYRVVASNVYGSTNSTNAALTVLNPPVVTVSFLRHLVDSSSYQATNSTLPYEVIGTVTTLTNITTGDTSSYYLQDGTGGINIFATQGSTFRPALGDVVDFVGVTSSFTSGLELYASTLLPQTSYTVLSNNIAGLPAAVIVPFTITNSLSNMVYNIAGKRVTLTNVYFGTNTGLVIATNSNTNISVTNITGDKFTVSFFSQDQDTAGQTLPAFATSVTGIMYGNTNFSVAVTKWSDIVVPSTSIPLSITNTQDGKVVVSWSDASFSLLSSTTADGTYTPVSGATSPYTNTVTPNGVIFFRLVK
jgi:hypothetical protein